MIEPEAAVTADACLNGDPLGAVRARSARSSDPGQARQHRVRLDATPRALERVLAVGQETPGVARQARFRALHPLFGDADHGVKHLGVTLAERGVGRAPGSTEGWSQVPGREMVLGALQFIGCAHRRSKTTWVRAHGHAVAEPLEDCRHVLVERWPGWVGGGPCALSRWSNVGSPAYPDYLSTT